MSSYDPYSYGAVPLGGAGGTSTLAGSAPSGAEPERDARPDEGRSDRRAPSATAAPLASGAPPRMVAPRARVSAGEQSSLLWLWLSSLTLITGAAGSSWLWLAQQNPVLAGIASAATLVATVFAGLLLRR